MRERLGAAKLFVGVTRNDVTVNNKGGATCSSTKQILKASSLVTKLIQILPNTASEALDPALNALSISNLNHTPELKVQFYNLQFTFLLNSSIGFKKA